MSLTALTTPGGIRLLDYCEYNIGQLPFYLAKQRKSLKYDLFAPNFLSNKGAYTRLDAIGVVINKGKKRFSIYSFRKGRGRQRGNTDVAIIIVAILIIVPSTSAANVPLLQTRKYSLWFAFHYFVGNLRYKYADIKLLMWRNSLPEY